MRFEDSGMMAPIERGALQINRGIILLVVTPASSESKPVGEGKDGTKGTGAAFRSHVFPVPGSSWLGRVYVTDPWRI